MQIETKVLKEAGYNEALLGMSLSFKDPLIPMDDWLMDDRKEKMRIRAVNLCDKDGGHNKFLESIQVWVYVNASRYFWQEFDTYRVGVTKNSGSTMHTLLKRPAVVEDFEDRLISHVQLEALNEALTLKDLIRAKQLLPEGYLQERIVNLNYKVLRGIIQQRANHRLPHWRKMINDLKDQLEHTELLPFNLLVRRK